MADSNAGASFEPGDPTRHLGESDEQWWERMQRDIRLSEVERIFSSDEAFEASLEDLDPSEIVPLTLDEADRLMRATLEACRT